MSLLKRSLPPPRNRSEIPLDMRPANSADPLDRELVKNVARVVMTRKYPDWKCPEWGVTRDAMGMYVCRFHIQGPEKENPRPEEIPSFNLTELSDIQDLSHTMVREPTISPDGKHGLWITVTVRSLLEPWTFTEDEIFVQRSITADSRRRKSTKIERDESDPAVSKGVSLHLMEQE